LVFLLAVAVFAVSTGCGRLRSAPTEANLERAMLSGDWQRVMGIAKSWHEHYPIDVVPAFLLWEATFRLGDIDGYSRARHLLDGVGQASFLAVEPLGHWARALTARHPDSAVAWQVAAQALWRSESHDDAMAAASTAVRLGPKDWASWEIRSGVRMNEGDYAGAEADLYRATALGPDSALLRVLRSIAYCALKRYDQALSEANKAVEMAPKAASTYAARGHCYVLMGQPRRAMADLSHAIELDPEETSVYGLRSEAYQALGDYGSALADKSEEVRLLPYALEPRTDRAELLDKTGDQQGAAGEYRDVLSRLDGAREAKAYDLRARAHAGLGQLSQEQADLTELICLEPRPAEAYARRLQVDASLGDLAQAVEDATHYIDLRPDAPKGYSARGALYLALGDYRRALADSTHIIETDRGVQAVGAYCSRGVAYEMEGEKDLAKRDFDEAERRAPGRTHRVVEEDRQYVLRLRTLAKARSR